jgi:hypothetical protein
VASTDNNNKKVAITPQISEVFFTIFMNMSIFLKLTRA